MAEKGCSQCTAVTKGRRCKRKSCKTGPFCWQHTQLRLKLSVKKSTVAAAGLGLFVHNPKDPQAVVFKEGDVVIDYTGQRMTKSELDRKYPGDTDAPYAMENDIEGYFVDAVKTNSGVARYANDCSPAGIERCNASLSGYHKEGVFKLAIIANKDLKHGVEIFVSYGSEYWTGDPTPALEAGKKRRDDAERQYAQDLAKAKRDRERKRKIKRKRKRKEGGKKKKKTNKQARLRF